MGWQCLLRFLFLFLFSVSKHWSLRLILELHQQTRQIFNRLTKNKESSYHSGTEKDLSDRNHHHLMKQELQGKDVHCCLSVQPLCAFQSVHGSLNMLQKVSSHFGSGCIWTSSKSATSWAGPDVSAHIHIQPLHMQRHMQQLYMNIFQKCYKWGVLMCLCDAARLDLSSWTFIYHRV